MNRRETAMLITLGSSGAITTQHFEPDDLVAEGYLDGGMFAPAHHPLLTLHDGNGDGYAAHGPRLKRGSRKRR